MQFHHQYINRVGFDSLDQLYHDNGYGNLRLVGFGLVKKLISHEIHSKRPSYDSFNNSFISRRRWCYRAAWTAVERESRRVVDPPGPTWFNNSRRGQKRQHNECKWWLRRIHYASLGRWLWQQSERGDELIILHFTQLFLFFWMIYWL